MITINEIVLAYEENSVICINCFDNTESYCYSVALFSGREDCSIAKLIAGSIVLFNDGELAENRDELEGFLMKLDNFSYSEITIDDIIKQRPQFTIVLDWASNIKNVIQCEHIYNFSLVLLKIDNRQKCLIFHTCE